MLFPSVVVRLLGAPSSWREKSLRTFLPFLCLSVWPPRRVSHTAERLTPMSTFNHVECLPQQSPAATPGRSSSATSSVLRPLSCWPQPKKKVCGMKTHVLLQLGSLLLRRQRFSLNSDFRKCARDQARGASQSTRSWQMNNDHNHHHHNDNEAASCIQGTQSSLWLANLWWPLWPLSTPVITALPSLAWTQFICFTTWLFEELPSRWEVCLSFKVKVREQSEKLGRQEPEQGQLAQPS